MGNDLRKIYGQATLAAGGILAALWVSPSIAAGVAAVMAVVMVQMASSDGKKG